jgi:serine/threonine protein kinase
MKVTLKNGSTLNLVSDPLGKGGEGNVYQVEKGQGLRSSFVAKIYRAEKRTQEQEKKINFLIAHPPVCESNGHTYLIWPKEAVYENGEFAGFLMAKASGIELEKLCLPVLDKNLGPEWQRFRHDSKDALKLRLSICRNLSNAVAAVQHKLCYVLVDMKPVNIFVDARAMVSMIDLDSVQVSERGHLLYSNNVFTAEYTPAEISGNELIKKQSLDNFTLGVIIYRLLTGIHPFTGSYKDIKLNQVADGIKAGLYAHGPKRTSFKVIPQLHKRLHLYPAAVNKLFSRCFDDGFTDPEKRPTATEWFVTLNELLTAPPVISSFDSSHTFVTDLTPVRLKWNVQNAVSAFIQGVGDVTGLTEIDLQVRQDTTFVLRAVSDSGKQTEQSVSVRVDKTPPEISVFEISRAVISAGDSVTLKWKVQRGETILANAAKGKVLPTDSITVKPASSTRYSLKAISCFGIESSRYIDVTVHPLPAIHEFNTSHSRVKPGKPVKLSWRSANCSQIVLSDGNTNEDVTGKSYIQIKPAVSTTFKLKITGLDGVQVRESSVDIEVLSDIRIRQLTASRYVTVQTVPTVLRWDVMHAKKLRLEPGGLDVTGTSALEVCPKQSVTYELIASHELHEVKKAVRIEVTPLPRIQNLQIPAPPILELRPPGKVWPLLPEFLSDITDPVEVSKVLNSQVLPGRSPYTGPVSRMLYHIRKLVRKAD